MKVMIAVVVTDRRKVSVQDKATAAPVDGESDEHFSISNKKINYEYRLQSIANAYAHSICCT